MAERLDHLLGESAERFPKRIAVRDCRGNELSYFDLEHKANAIAELLIRQGLKRSDRVGINSHKSLEVLAAIFGIYKAGGTFVPLPPDSPTDRNLFIVSNCQIELVLAEESFCRTLQDQAKVQTQEIDQDLLDLKLIRFEQGNKQQAQEELAYILYTSGSTGMPKGVTFTHRNALSFVEWCADTFEVDETKIFSSHAAFHFDLSVLDIYLSIMHGACMVIIDEATAKNPFALSAMIAEQKITHWYSTPTILKLLMQFGKMDRFDHSSLEVVNFAGEVFHGKYLRELKQIWPKPIYYNLYGPTETNVCTYHRIPDEVPADREDPYPIGKVCEHLTDLLLDPKDGLAELCIEGEAVTGGYWNLPDRNESAFFQQDGKLWYRTGDIVKLDEAGDYLFIDRIDRMVKRRGYRIELGEIEAALHKHPKVLDAAVAAGVNARKDTLIKAFLKVSDSEGMDLIGLKQYCADNLPMYMIPDSFELMDEIDKTSTNKTDYKSLEKRI